MRLPGTAWVALIVALIGWLQGDWFAGQLWVPAVVIVLGAATKLIETYAASRSEIGLSRGQTAGPAGWVTWLLG
jgi:hypothetical protein